MDKHRLWNSSPKVNTGVSVAHKNDRCLLKISWYGTRNMKNSGVFLNVHWSPCERYLNWYFSDLSDSLNLLNSLNSRKVLLPLRKTALTILWFSAGLGIFLSSLSPSVDRRLTLNLRSTFGHKTWMVMFYLCKCIRKRWKMTPVLKRNSDKTCFMFPKNALP